MEEKLKQKFEENPELGRGLLPRKSESVRSTFKTSEEALRAKKWIAEKMDMSEKEALDDMWEYVIKGHLDDLLDDLLRELDSESLTVRKVHVLSDRTLASITDFAKSRDVSRDLAFEALIRLGEMTIKWEIEFTRLQRGSVLKDLVDPAIKYLEELDDELKEYLDDDDPILLRWSELCVVASNLASAIRANVENGTPIDPYDSAQSG